MKHLTNWLLSALMIPASAFAVAPEVLEAQRNGAKVSIPLAVIDENGKPVSGAKVNCRFFNGLGKTSDVRGLTDNQGFFHVGGSCKYYVNIGVLKGGFYSSWFKQTFGSHDQKPAVVDGKWQPYGEVRKIILKKVESKGDLVVYNPQSIDSKIPALGKWLPFDLEVFDWVQPIGRGVHEDAFLRFSYVKGNAGPWDYSAKMELSFTNNPYAGAYVKAKDNWSELKSAKQAETNANFMSEIEFGETIRPDGKDRKFWLDENSYLVYRTRTKVDENGNLVSAHYGKIYGQWSSGKSNVRLPLGCFNPRENDPDIEDDCKVREILRRSK